MAFQNIIHKMTLNPRSLFLIDGVGALLSAFLLGVVLVRFENIFGMPKEALYFLGFIPCLFALYDFFCFKKTNKNHGSDLKGIAYANLIYCGISTIMLFQHAQTLTSLGWGYFLPEIAVVFTLVYIELKTAGSL